MSEKNVLLELLPDKVKESKSVDGYDFFFSLFVFNGDQSYEYDKSTGELRQLTDIKFKIEIEINKAVSLLLKGKIREKDPSDLPVGKTHIRTICMLLALKKYLRAKPNVGCLCQKINSLNSSNGDFWCLSFGLLLVQAVRFSMWEWQNHDDCFEYFSAIRAEDYLRQKLSECGCAESDAEFEEIRFIFVRLIRWQSINGQKERNSSNFGVPEILNIIYTGNTEKHNELYEIEEELLQAISYSDHILRTDKHKYEKRVADLVFRLKKNDNLDFYSETEKIFDGNDPEKFSIDRNKNANGDLLKIYSYMRILGGEKSDEDIIRGYIRKCVEKNIIHRKHREHRDDEAEGFIHHYILNRADRNLGLLRKLVGRNHIDDCFTLCLDSVKYLNNEKIKEKIYYVAVKPQYIAGIAYGRDLPIKTGTVMGPIAFLKESFSAIIKDQGKLPLPLVKRMNDLLKYYYISKGEDDAVFPARIVFDDGEHEIDVWLPDKIESADNEKVSDQYTVADILVRYLTFYISNYGMTRQYNRVDLDFSASKEFIEGTPHPWRQQLNDPDKGSKMHGVSVFERYLDHCSNKIIEKTFSREKYLKFISKRRSIDAHCFEKFDKISDMIKNRYVLGMDIGATGIKAQFYKIMTGIGDNTEAFEGFFLSPNVPSENDSNLFLVPAKINNYDLVYTIPTFPSTKIDAAGEKIRYKDVKEFADYIAGKLVDRLKSTLKEADEAKDEVLNDILDHLISIGICWPGPIKQNRIASTSGALSYFEGYSSKIMLNDRAKITELDLADAVKQAFEGKRLHCEEPDNTNSLLTVALSNDGDVEAAGLAFGKVNAAGASLTRDEKWKSFFEKHSVVIIKAGTGTAGSIIIDGVISGLNEFGKLIIDLAADNRSNREKKNDDRWPQGDANKNFSIKAFRSVVKKAGGSSPAAEEVTGRDISWLLENENVNGKGSKADIDYIPFGVLELIMLAEPNIEWSDLLDDKGHLKKDISLVYSDRYKIVPKSEGDRIDGHTWWRLANERKNCGLCLPEHEPQTLNDLLIKMGKSRYARFNFENIKIKKIEKGLEEIGKGLAHIIAHLHDIYRIDLGVFCGGPLQNDKIREKIFDGFKEELKMYIQDYQHDEDYTTFNLTEKWNDLKDSDKYKFRYLPSRTPYAPLGAAIIGFDHYVTEQKIRELQKLNRQPDNGTLEDLCFLSKKEIEKFLASNAVKLQITLQSDSEDLHIAKLDEITSGIQPSS